MKKPGLFASVAAASATAISASCPTSSNSVSDSQQVNLSLISGLSSFSPLIDFEFGFCDFTWFCGGLPCLVPEKIWSENTPVTLGKKPQTSFSFPVLRTLGNPTNFLLSSVFFPFLFLQFGVFLLECSEIS